MTNILKKHKEKIHNWMTFNPPFALSSKGWRLFRKEFKEKAPIRYYFHHEFRTNFILPVIWIFEDIKKWIRYRTYDRYHILDTGLRPGYHGIQEQMLHVNFNMLKEFVEVEQAWQNYCWNNSGNISWFEKHMPFYRLFFPFRSPEYGIKHFEWAATLDDPSLPQHEKSIQQAEHAREILALYKWWVIDRPSRKEIEIISYNDQGLGDMLACFDDDFDRNAEDFRTHEDSMEARNKQEEEWINEDTEMLIRLIKIRNGLWT